MLKNDGDIIESRATTATAAAASARGRSKRRTVSIKEGIKVSPMPITLGEMVTVQYDGLLAKSGAKQVFAHIGYGSNEFWTGIQDIPMVRTRTAWTCNLTPMASRVNLCFHDGIENWDNNNGVNWSFTIHNGNMYEH